LDLRARLVLAQRTLARPVTHPASNYDESDVPLSMRLRRLFGDQAETEAPKRLDIEQIARLLRGEPLADGVIVIEDFVPFSQSHGQVPYDDIERISLQFLAGGEEPPRRGLLFLDLETSGLAGGTGTVAFVLGTARIDDDVVRLRQYFLTSFCGEAAMLTDALSWIRSATHLVSFNGKCFDVPLLITRYRLLGAENPFAHVSHIDLLHPARAAFAGAWPDCRLQTVEQYLFRLHRDDDLPGYLIPQVWTGFLRYGETRGLRGILEHNRMDLLSLVALSSVLARTYAEPGQRYANPLALSRAQRRRGRHDVAVRHLEEHGTTLSEQAQLELGSLYARSHQWKEAVAIWESLANEGVIQAMERLAKYSEHVRRDLSAALRYTEALVSRDVANPTHEHRLQRLRRKLLG
jgi:uncharacterized protein